MHLNARTIRSIIKILQMNILITLPISNAHHIISRHNLLTLIIFLLTQTPPPSTAQPLPAPPPVQAGKKSVAGVMVVVAVLFFISGFLSLYTRQCADRRPRTRGNRLDLALPIGGGSNGRRLNMEPRGLNPDVIESFPTFLYATVKGLMVAKEVLACAVCLDEFQDHETLRLIPNCSHVFHPACIDAWLASNSTCPVCRANLVPRSEEEEEPPFVALEAPHDDPLEHHHQPNDNDNNAVIGVTVESPKENTLGRIRSCTNRAPPRSRSTGFLFGMLFRRSDSSGRSVERCERFTTTVRLPEEVRRRLAVNCTRLKRARSCVSFGRMGSGRRGYRARSVGSGGGRRYWEWQFHGEEEQWGFALTTPFFARSARRSSPAHDHGVAGERSSDHLCPGILANHQGG